MKKKINNILFYFINKILQILSTTVQYFLFLVIVLLIFSFIVLLLTIKILEKLYKANYKFFNKGSINVSITNERWKED